MIKGVIFDFDGTLVDSFSMHLESYRKAIEACGLSKTRTEILDACFNHTDAVAAENLGITDPSVARRFSRIYTENVLDSAAGVELYDHALNVIRELRGRGFLLAMATTRGRTDLDTALQALGIGELFDATVTVDDVARPKPAPDSFERAAELLGLQADQVLSVGDSPHDLESIHAAKQIAVLHFPDWHEDVYDEDRLRSLEPEYVVSSLQDLLALPELNRS